MKKSTRNSARGISKKQNSLPRNRSELLAPAGNFPMLVAAVNAGADAIYFGFKDYSMRKNAKNFTIKDLDEINKICKEKKVKKYLVLNTIIYDEEIKKIENIIKKVKGKIDAIIAWDFSIINLCKKYKIPFFISTQASVSNVSAAKFYKKLGAKRIVLARELNLSQIKKISKIIDIECFCHGAMCVAVSGRCFTSQFLFNRSANRGECIQPCRRSYIVKEFPKGEKPVKRKDSKYVIEDKQEGYELEIENDKIMSAKDLCTLQILEELKKAGIKSFKIEGRNRDARYIDTVVRIYRKAIDKKLSKEEIKENLKELKKVYNREFSSGFYLGLPTKDDFAKVEHSKATEKKHFVGKVIHYFPKVGVATIKLVSELKVKDKIVIIGKTTGIKNSVINSMEIRNKKVKIGKKGDEVGIKLPRIRKNDEVYKIVKTKNKK